MASSAPRACARQLRTTPLRRDIGRCARAHDFPTQLLGRYYVIDLNDIFWLMSQPAVVMRKYGVRERKAATVVRNAQWPRSPPSEGSKPYVLHQFFTEFGELQATGSQVPLQRPAGPRLPSNQDRFASPFLEVLRTHPKVLSALTAK